ncbi:MAG: zf-HC2 domain-containing protein [Clostridium sartagoforme]|nr:zf-HC2 domain-containing protein [Clostridium sartagoforme]
MEVNCNVIKDILPLYHEDMVSEDTRLLVENHIDKCIDCKKELEEMKTSTNIPIDINTNGFKKVKTKLFQDRFKAIIYSISLTMIILIIGINFFTKPIYLLYSKENVSINKKDNGEIFVSFNNVSNYDINKQYSQEGSSYSYSITAWETRWDKFFNNNKFETVVLNPNGEKIDSIYYYSGGQEDDVLIYGNGSEHGIRLTLPRLVLGLYLLISIGLTGIFFIAMLLVHKSSRGKNIMMKVLLIPTAYALGTICIKGFNTSSYSLQRDFFIILIISIPIYLILLITIEFLRSYKYRLGKRNLL